jgi:hypothetical protein
MAQASKTLTPLAKLAILDLDLCRFLFRKLCAGGQQASGGAPDSRQASPLFFLRKLLERPRIVSQLGRHLGQSASLPGLRSGSILERGKEDELGRAAAEAARHLDHQLVIVGNGDIHLVGLHWIIAARQ